MDFQQFNGQHWRRTIPETYAAFAKSAAVLEATPMTEAKMMPRLLREIIETTLDIHLDLGNWLQGFLPCGLKVSGSRVRHDSERTTNPLPADAVTIPADARGAFHPPPAADTL